MYSVATLTFGKTAGLAFMHPIAHVMPWVAVAAWTLVAAALVVRLTRNQADWPRRGTRAPPVS